MPIKINVSAKTLAKQSEVVETSRVNEDALLWKQNQGVFGVFDGLGGHYGGDKASRLAVKIFTQALESLPEIEHRSAKAALKWLRETAQEANRTIHIEIGRYAGTTAVVMLFYKFKSEYKIAVLNSGDSRLYGLRHQSYYNRYGRRWMYLKSLTRDQSIYFHPKLDFVSHRSELTEHLANLFGNRYGINAALGVELNLKYKISTYKVKEFKSFLLTSDGIHDGLNQLEIQEEIMSPKYAEHLKAKALIRAALKRSADETHLRSKQDDMTAIYIAVKPE